MIEVLCHNLLHLFVFEKYLIIVMIVVSVMISLVF